MSYKSSHVQKRVRISLGAGTIITETHTQTHTVDSDARSVLADVIMSLLPCETDARCDAPTHTKNRHQEEEKKNK